MNSHKLNKLSKELRQAGADPSELPALLSLVQQLKQLPADNPSAGLPVTTLPRFPNRLVVASFSGFIGLLLGATVIMFSQTSLPGGWLYPLKRLSEQTAALIHPDYKVTAMMRRAQEVQALVARHESSQRVLTTLTAYQQAAAVYKSTSTTYSAFEYCRAELQQAESQASPQERQAIQATLDMLPDA